MIEWKQKYALNGLLLYVLSMAIVLALAFKGLMDALIWNALYWLMLLFGAINTVAKSFLAERPGQLRYLYSLAPPEAIILAKFCYNALLLWVVAILSMIVFATLSEQTFVNVPLLFGIISLGALALAANLTLISAIASRADNPRTLLAVLSFPILVPILLLLIGLSEHAITGSGHFEFGSSLRFLGGLTLVLTLLSVILFPLLWRE